MRKLSISRRHLLGGCAMVAGLNSLECLALGSVGEPQIALSSTEASASAIAGELIGSLSIAGDPSWVFSLTDNIGGMFVISNHNLMIGSPPPCGRKRISINIQAVKGDRIVSRAFSIRFVQPKPKDRSSLTFASNRVSFPVASQTTGIRDRCALGHSMHVAPDYGVTGGMRLLFCNFYVDQSGTNQPEKKPGTHKTLDFVTVFVGDRAYPVTFDGREGTAIPDGGFIWSDVVMNGSEELALPPRETYYVRVAETTPVGGRRVFNAGQQLQIGRWSNWSTGEGVEYTPFPMAEKKTSGEVNAFSGGSASVAPSMIVAKGWNGSAVYALFGDSVGASVGDFGSDRDNRGTLGYIGRALDDIESGRRSYANFCVPGTKPQDQCADVEGQMALRLAAIRALPNQPFNKIISRMGQNGIFLPHTASFPQFGARQPENLQNAMLSWWEFLWDEFGCDVFQLTITPRSQNTPKSNAAWTNSFQQVPTDSLVDSYPKGARFEFNRWLLQADTVPKYVTVIDDREAFYCSKVRHAWNQIEGDWILESEAAADATKFTFSGNTPPQQGDSFVIDPGTPNVDVRTSYRVTGQGPWTVYVTKTGTQHRTGARIRAASTIDGLHPAHSLHVLGANLLVTSKLAGVLP